MIELNRKRRLLITTAHLLGCVVSLLVLLALPTLRFHHLRTAVQTREVEREAARQSFVTPSDSAPLIQIARAVRRWQLGATTTDDRGFQRLRCTASVSIVTPRARFLVRLKLPPSSQDPFHSIFA